MASTRCSLWRTSAPGHRTHRSTVPSTRRPHRSPTRRPTTAGWRRGTTPACRSRPTARVVEPHGLDPPRLGRPQPDRREAQSARAGMPATSRHGSSVPATGTPAGTRRCRPRARGCDHRPSRRAARPSTAGTRCPRWPRARAGRRSSPAGGPSAPAVPSASLVLERQMHSPRKMRLELVPTSMDVHRDALR